MPTSTKLSIFCFIPSYLLIFLSLLLCLSLHSHSAVLCQTLRYSRKLVLCVHYLEICGS